MIRALLLSLLLLSGCRSIQRATSSNSTAQTQAETAKFNREIVTEYVIRDTTGGKPVIVNVQPALGNSEVRPQAPVIVYPRGEIVRQTIRESGEQQSSTTQQSDVKTEEKEAGMPFLIQIAALVAAIGIALIALAALIFLIKK